MKINHAFNHADLDALNNMPTARWAGAWCELNRWEWPVEIPKPELHTSGDNPRRTFLMTHIVKKIGRKRCMEEWNKDI